MIGLVVASHGGLAAQLLETAKGIVGELPHTAVCSIEPSMSASDFKAHLKDAISQVDGGNGVLVLTDLMGGSPCIQSLSLCHARAIEVVTGANLPMIIKAGSLRHSAADLHALASDIIAYGQRNIGLASDAVRGKMSAA